MPQATGFRHKQNGWVGLVEDKNVEEEEEHHHDPS
jgi:hypothetical protein